MEPHSKKFKENAAFKRLPYPIFSLLINLEDQSVGKIWETLNLNQKMQRNVDVLRFKIGAFCLYNAFKVEFLKKINYPVTSGWSVGSAKLSLVTCIFAVSLVKY